MRTPLRLLELSRLRLQMAHNPQKLRPTACRISCPVSGVGPGQLNSCPTIREKSEVKSLSARHLIDSFPLVASRHPSPDSNLLT